MTAVRGGVAGGAWIANQTWADTPDGIVKLFGNACGAVDVSGLAGERWWLTASFKPLRR